MSKVGKTHVQPHSEVPSGSFADEQGIEVAQPGLSPAAPEPPAAVQHDRPSVTGSQLQLAQGETATKRALELTEQLSASQADRQGLSRRVEELQSTLKMKEASLSQTQGELVSERDAAAKSREQVSQLQTQNAQLRDEAKRAQWEKLTTLKNTMQLLKEVAEGEATERRTGERASETPQVQEQMQESPAPQGEPESRSDATH